MPWLRRGASAHAAQPADPLAVALKREQKRLERRALNVTIAALAVFTAVVVVAAATGLWRLLPGTTAFALVWAGFLGLLSLEIACHYFLVVRPLAPARDLCGYAVVMARQGWTLLDGNPEISFDPKVTLQRVGDRTDGIATFLRVGALMLQGDRKSAHAILDGWSPTDPADKARRVRITEQVAYEETGEGQLSEVRSAIAGIPDEEIRKGQQAIVALEEARRAAARGEPVLDPLRAARPDLGKLDFSTLRWRQNPRTPERLDAAFFVILLAGTFVVFAILASPAPI